MEHVGPKNLPIFFDKCRELLDPDGMMLHHTIGSNDWQTAGDPWFDRYIFPGGVLPSLGQIGKAAQSHWTIEDVHNFGPYYNRTLLAWHANISGSLARDTTLRRTFSTDVALLLDEFSRGLSSARHPALAGRVHSGKTWATRMDAGSLSC